MRSFNNQILTSFFLQRLYTLPEMLAARFRLYLNVLPLVEGGIMYFFFAVGSCFLLFSLYKFLTSKSKRNFYNTQWIEDDFLNIEKKLSNYKPKKRASMNAKELEVYFSSLVTPLNQDLTCHDSNDEDA